jgi:hypothetical protein
MIAVTTMISTNENPSEDLWNQRIVGAPCISYFTTTVAGKTCNGMSWPVGVFRHGRYVEARRPRPHRLEYEPCQPAVPGGSRCGHRPRDGDVDTARNFVDLRQERRLNALPAG